MAVIRWLVGGLIGGAAGIAIWVLVGYYTHHEVGWIAWGVGFLTGLGVRYVAFLGGEEASFGKGLLACLMAIGAILAAKYLVFVLSVGGKGHENPFCAANQMRCDDEALIARIANDIADETINRGEKIAWPAGISRETASKPSDFPANLWKAAQARWNQLGPNGQEQERERLLRAMALSEQARWHGFVESFTLWDLLWFGLAIFTAYHVGNGTFGTD